MDVQNLCKNYFSGLGELTDKDSNIQTRSLAALKVLSYLTIFLPLIFGIIQGVSTLANRKVTKEKGGGSVDPVAEKRFSSQSSPSKLPITQSISTGEGATRPSLPKPIPTLEKLNISEIKSLAASLSDEEILKLSLSQIPDDARPDAFGVIFYTAVDKTGSSRAERLIPKFSNTRIFREMFYFSKEHWKWISDDQILNRETNFPLFVSRNPKNLEEGVNALFNEDKERWKRIEHLLNDKQLAHIRPYLKISSATHLFESYPAQQMGGERESNSGIGEETKEKKGFEGKTMPEETTNKFLEPTPTTLKQKVYTALNIAELAKLSDEEVLNFDLSRVPVELRESAIHFLFLGDEGEKLGKLGAKKIQEFAPYLALHLWKYVNRKEVRNLDFAEIFQKIDGLLRGWIFRLFKDFMTEEQIKTCRTILPLEDLPERQLPKEKSYTAENLRELEFLSEEEACNFDLSRIQEDLREQALQYLFNFSKDGRKRLKELKKGKIEEFSPNLSPGHWDHFTSEQLVELDFGKVFRGMPSGVSRSMIYDKLKSYMNDEQLRVCAKIVGAQISQPEMSKGETAKKDNKDSRTIASLTQKSEPTIQPKSGIKSREEIIEEYAWSFAKSKEIIERTFNFNKYIYFREIKDALKSSSFVKDPENYLENRSSYALENNLVEEYFTNPEEVKKLASENIITEETKERLLKFAILRENAWEFARDDNIDERTFNKYTYFGLLKKILKDPKSHLKNIPYSFEGITVEKYLKNREELQKLVEQGIISPSIRDKLLEK